MRLVHVVFCAMIAIALTSANAAPPRLIVPRTDKPPTLDGRLAAGEWDGAATARLRGFT